MAVMTQRVKFRLVRYGVAVERSTKPARSGAIRPCMAVSAALILAGFALVFLMLLSLLPVTFLTAFLGFALVALGGTMVLVFCGEI